MQNTSNPNRVIVSWDYPTPRGLLDRFIGPGATRAELLVQFVPTILIATAWPIVALSGNWGWSTLQIVLIVVFSIDLVGGVITNATSSAKRWYHRHGQGFVAHMGFVLIHVHPFLIIALYDPGNWTFAIAAYAYLLFGALVILLMPLYLQRPIAFLLLIGGIFLSLYGLRVPTNFEWFLPLYYIKLFTSHLLYEEPYRPSTS